MLEDLTPGLERPTISNTVQTSIEKRADLNPQPRNPKLRTLQTHEDLSAAVFVYGRRAGRGSDVAGQASLLK